MNHFEQAAEIVTPEVVTKSIPCGPDIVEELVASVGQNVDAGYDHVYFHQIGPDQDGFFGFWERELQPAPRASGARRGMTPELIVRARRARG